MNVKIEIDGSCLNNGLPTASAGWSVVVKGEMQEKLYGKLPGEIQTNNRAELFALLQALQWVKDHSEVKASIYSDSKLVVEGVLGDAQRKANRDIWEQIEAICPAVSHQISDFAHHNREVNTEADELAKKAANALFIINK